MIDEVKRLINEYNNSGENKIWINYDNIQYIHKSYEESEYTKTLTYNIFLNTIKIILIWSLYKETGKENIAVYVDYLYDISC